MLIRRLQVCCMDRMLFSNFSWVNNHCFSSWPCLLQSNSRIILFCSLIESSHSRQCLAMNLASQSAGSVTDVLSPSARTAKCNLHVSTLSQPELWKIKSQGNLATGAVIPTERFVHQLISKIMLWWCIHGAHIFRLLWHGVFSFSFCLLHVSSHPFHSFISEI